MKPQEIIEGKRLFAKFLGWIDSPFDNLPNKLYSKDLSEGKSLECFNYDSSLDELILVVNKIRSIDISPPPNYRGYRIEIVIDGYVSISGFPMPTILKNMSVEGGLNNALFMACMEFVKWYNQNKEK